MNDGSHRAEAMKRLAPFLRTRRQFWQYDGRYTLTSFGPLKYIAKIDTEMAGISWADETAPGEARMHMTLKPEYAEFGIGTELLETLAADLKDSGYQVIHYEIDVKYESYQIYHNMGFVIESRTDDRIHYIWRAEGGTQ